MLNIVVFELYRIIWAKRLNQSFLRISKKATKQNLVITSRVLRSPAWLGWPLWTICVTNDHGNVPLVVKHIPILSLHTLPEHLISPPVFSGVRVIQSYVLCVGFVDRCLSFSFWPLRCLFFFDLRILIAPLVSSNASWDSRVLLYICLMLDWMQK